MLDNAERTLQLLLDTPAAAAAPAAPHQPNNANPLSAPAVFAALTADSAAALGASSSQPLKTLVRAFLSGCYIALGGLVAASVVGASPKLWWSTAPGLARLVFALIFPVGLSLSLAHGGELFTGQTMRAPLAAAFDMGGGRSGVPGGGGGGGGATTSGPRRLLLLAQQVAGNWALSFTGNFAGALAVLALVLAAGLFPAGSSAAAFAASIADAKLSLSFSEALCRGLLANWLVCMAVWQASAARTWSDRFFAVWPPIAAFVACGLEHSVASMFLVPLGLAVGGGGGGLDAASFARFLTANLLPVTIGNALAGVVVVAGLSQVVYGGGDGARGEDRGLLLGQEAAAALAQT